ncbi:hypothetical protein B0H16DRAFT_1733283 [Mycena metata]|uniref:Uncharacterized protein n=1 Tax=Mycena metata TaxID=1033252 RepID=A0AAD7I0N0_9AGAR|nr:hypothetical protein B0H16DRAFT_1733283 [Mycena metata]
MGAIIISRLTGGAEFFQQLFTTHPELRGVYSDPGLFFKDLLVKEKIIGLLGKLAYDIFEVFYILAYHAMRRSQCASAAFTPSTLLLCLAWAAIPPASHLPALFSTFSLDAAEAHLVKKFDPPSVEESNLSPIKPYVRRPVQPRPRVFENGRRDDADNSDVDMGGKGTAGGALQAGDVRTLDVCIRYLLPLLRAAPAGIESESAEERRGGNDSHRGRMRGLFIVPAHLRSLAVRGGDYERRYGFVSHRYSGRVVLRSLAFAYANIPICAPRTSHKHDFETQVYIECNTPRNHRTSSFIYFPLYFYLLHFMDGAAARGCRWFASCHSLRPGAMLSTEQKEKSANAGERRSLTNHRFRGRTRFGEGKSSGELVFGAALEKEERRTEKLTRTAFSIQTLVPAEQVQPHTLIAAVITDGVDFTGTHIYFVSPDNILSEYINPGGAWIGGPTCTTCIDGNRFAVQPGNSVFYALANNGPSESAFIRVGFVSAGAPGALSEAVFTTANGWTLAQVSS